ncbi:MAG: hypothetical protein ACI865_000048 [Flavobacteriaceae bacterium]|jgi:hypothetical protein
MKKSFIVFGLLIAILSSCSTDTANDTTLSESTPPADAIELSFVFVGCNRMWWKDPMHSDKSMANINALKRVGDELAGLPDKPDLFFFLGDIVSGEATDPILNTQLSTWASDYNGSTFGSLKSSGIELIAVPGNHEMLNQHETPLAHTTQTWMKHMGKYMPKKRDTITGATSKVNQMTYSFTRGNVAFVVMNTDTYNEEGKNNIGLEGQIPYTWVKNKVSEYHADTSIHHIFALGHRPFYVACKRDTSHQGMPNPDRSTPVWDAFESANVAAMLSAHVHQYQRMQPNNKTYQIIAGNGGSPLYDSIPPPFFGYTRINVWSSGRIELISNGYKGVVPYYAKSPHKWSIRDQADLNWYRPSPFVGGPCECENGVPH